MQTWILSHILSGFYTVTICWLQRQKKSILCLLFMGPELPVKSKLFVSTTNFQLVFDFAQEFVFFDIRVGITS